MGGPGFVDICMGARLKPKFLCKVDKLSREFAANPARAQRAAQELEAMPSKAHLLSYGQATGLYEAAELDHFRKEWLGDSGYFPRVNARRRFSVIRAAFQDISQRIARTGKPVVSSWKCDSPGFDYDICEGNHELFLTFYTPRPEISQAAAATYERDESVCVGHYDEHSDEIIREPGYRQRPDPDESES